MERPYVNSRAHFVRFPSRLEDLRRPYLWSDQQPYSIAKTITLARIDYENFITDFCVERQYLEDNAGLCGKDAGGVLHCLLIRQRGSHDGVLVLPDRRGYVILAAYILGTEP
jgi:hypothetical protein